MARKHSTSQDSSTVEGRAEQKTTPFYFRPIRENRIVIPISENHDRHLYKQWNMQIP